MAPADWYDWDGVCARLAAMTPLWPAAIILACGSTSGVFFASTAQLLLAQLQYT